MNIDLQPSEKHHISGRRTDASYLEYQPFDQGSGLTGKYFNRPNQTNTVSWTWTVSPSLINEARATFSLDDVYIPVNTALAGFNRSQFGINYPYLMPNGKDLPQKIPTVNVPNFYGLAGGPVPVSLVRTYLDGRRHLDQSLGQSHLQGRDVVGVFR